MSLFERFGERQSPGPVGTIEGGPAPQEHWDPRTIRRRAIIATTIVIALGLSLALLDLTNRDIAALLIAFGIYGALSHWVHPRPDYSNVGWANGLVDHPFRWSDDANRWLAATRVLLAPGRFIVTSLRDGYLLLRGRRIMVLPPRAD